LLVAAVGCGGESHGDGAASPETGGASATGGASTTGGSSNALGGTTGSENGGTTNGVGSGGTTSGSGGTTNGSGGTTSGSGGTTNGSGGTTSGSGGGAGVDISTSCPTLTPCGGNLVGTWRLQTLCSNSTCTSGCPDEIKSLTYSGNVLYDFTSDGRVNVVGTLNADLEISVSDACAQSANLADAQTYCTEQQSSASGSGGAGDSSSFDCTYKAPNCECSVKGSTAIDDSGTYAVSGTQVTITSSGGDSMLTTSTSSFCVSGDTLIVGASDGTMRTGGVLTRQ
jgi:hypothetical protein